MDRQPFLHRSTSVSLALGLSRIPVASPPETNLAGTAPLSAQGDVAKQMVNGIHRFLLKRTADASEERQSLWKRDYSSSENYSKSMASNRVHLRKTIGATDPLATNTVKKLLATATESGVISQTADFRICVVRWRVLDKLNVESVGISAGGLLVQPAGPPEARVVAIPDADRIPKMLLGLASGIPPQGQLGRKLAENGYQIPIPVLINRDDSFSGVPGIGMTHLTHRECICRMASEVGRHIIGYEVEKVLATSARLGNNRERLISPAGKPFEETGLWRRIMGKRQGIGFAGKQRRLARIQAFFEARLPISHSRPFAQRCSSGF